MMRKFLSKHPILWSAVTVCLFVFTMIAASTILAFAPTFFFQHGEYLPQLTAESFLCLVGIALVAISGHGYIWNKTERFWRGILCGGYIIVMSVVSAAMSLFIAITDPEAAGYSGPLFIEPAFNIIVFVITMFLIGLTEESFFRGVVANLFWDKHAKDPAGIWTATIYSGFMFGLMHALNLMSVDSDGIGGVFVQMAAASVMGMAFTAIYYRCKNIWATVFLHSFLDFCGLLTSGLFGSGSISDAVGSYSPLLAITNSLPYLIVTLVLLRKSKLKQMLAEDEAERNGGVPVAENAEYTSSPESLASKNRAVIIAIIAWAVMFATSIFTNAEFKAAMNDAIGGAGISLGNEIISVENSGEWSGEQTFGTKYKFTVSESGDYRISIDSEHSDSNGYVLVLIKGENGETYYENNFGGNCEISVPIALDAGNYELNLVYNYSEVSSKGAEYDTKVTIK